MFEPIKNINILLLAAGSSSRLGSPKQLVEIDGEPLLCASARTALRSEANHVVVVLGHNASHLENVLADVPVKICTNEDWHTGMGSSLNRGVSELMRIDPEMDGILVMVCDQPHVSTDHLNKLIYRFRQSGKMLVASQYHGTIGVPALFDKSYFDELLTLYPEAGARTLIRKHITVCETVTLPGGEIDLDTPEDVARFLKSRNKKS
jgi:molybdenum cofactor cytidylyltransferase